MTCAGELGDPRGMTAAFPALFARFRAMFAPHAPSAVVLRDEPGRYYLGTHEVREKDGYRTGFGGTEIGKRYVSVHLIPVYVHPEMLATISPALRRRMQGKSCFNFRTEDEALFAELQALIDLGAAQFASDGRLKPE